MTPGVNGIRLPALLAIFFAGFGLVAATSAPRPGSSVRPARLHVCGEAPKPPGDLRRCNPLVMDVDFEESAAAINGDIINIAGTLQLILDRIAAQTVPTKDFGEPRSIVWVALNGDNECHDATDAGIVGHQVTEADPCSFGADSDRVIRLHCTQP